MEGLQKFDLKSSSRATENKDCILQVGLFGDQLVPFNVGDG